MKPPLYDPEAVQPYRDELVAVGFEETFTPDEVKAAVENNSGKTVLYMINSVCGCAAGTARPGISLALQNNVIPDKLYTVFAGQEREAVEKLREYIPGFPPSSPSVALFKDGKLIYFMPRYEIEGREADEISEDLKAVFDKLCSAEGPSIPQERFEKIQYLRICGSKIPRFQG